MSQSPSSSRPLSPHLQIYKPQLTSVLSIVHRITGLWLALGTAVLVLWLYALAFAPALFVGLMSLFTSVGGKLLLFSWLLAFNYHLCNGVRHLFWDAGKGFELRQVYRSGYSVLVMAVALTAFFWFLSRG